MNQILSIIVAIAMAFTSMAGMTAGIEGAVSFDLKIGIDSEAVSALAAAGGEALPEETAQGIKVAADVLNALTLKGTADQEAAELVLLAGEDVVLSIGAKNDESGVTVASSLLGEDAVFVSAQMIGMMQQEMAQSAASGTSATGVAAASGLDQEQAAKDCEEAFAPLSQAIEAKKGETETGEFTVDGMVFTARTPVNMTYTEFAGLFLACLKDLMSRDSMKQIAQANGTDMAAEIDKAIENLKNQPEEEKPALDLAVYTDGGNGTYTVCSLAREAEAEGTANEKIYAAFGEAEGLGKVHVSVVQNTQEFEFLFDGDTEKGFEASVTVNDGHTYTVAAITGEETGRINAAAEYGTGDSKINIAAVCEPAEGERTAFTAEVYYNGTEKPVLTLSGSFGKSTEGVASFAGEALNVIPVETLADTENETAAGQLQMKMMAGLLKAVTVVTKNVPADTATWINTQIRQMMTPATPAAPQGN